MENRQKSPPISPMAHSEIQYRDRQVSLDYLIQYVNRGMPEANVEQMSQKLKQHPPEQHIIDGLNSFRQEGDKDINKEKVIAFIQKSSQIMTHNNLRESQDQSSQDQIKNNWFEHRFEAWARRNQGNFDLKRIQKKKRFSIARIRRFGTTVSESDLLKFSGYHARDYDATIPFHIKKSDNLIGKVGRVISPLKPIGIIEIDGQKIEAKSVHGFGHPGDKVRVVGRSPSLLQEFHVELIEDRPS